MTIKTKTVVIDGKKYLEKSFKKVVPVSDYGISKIKGAQIKSEANLNVQFTIDDAADYTMLKGYLNNKLVPLITRPINPPNKQIHTNGKANMLMLMISIVSGKDFIRYSELLT